MTTEINQAISHTTQHNSHEDGGNERKKYLPDGLFTRNVVVHFPSQGRPPSIDLVKSVEIRRCGLILGTENLLNYFCKLFYKEAITFVSRSVSFVLFLFLGLLCAACFVIFFSLCVSEARGERECGHFECFASPSPPVFLNEKS